MKKLIFANHTSKLYSFVIFNDTMNIQALINICVQADQDFSLKPFSVLETEDTLTKTFVNNGYRFLDIYEPALG